VEQRRGLLEASGLDDWLEALDDWLEACNKAVRPVCLP
jgi:hypothetical protein